MDAAHTNFFAPELRCQRRLYPQDGYEVEVEQCMARNEVLKIKAGLHCNISWRIGWGDTLNTCGSGKSRWHGYGTESAQYAKRGR
jgi:hypothetical protein